MPLQNRVTPFGSIVAHPARGLLTGNRGILHDPATRTLGRRRWTTKAWIACTCAWKGIRREVMGGRSWTELFFLDEATALAAGHRPCFLCRRADAVLFREAWSRAHGAPVRAPAIDAVLHHERLDRAARPVPRDLPDGTMLAAGEAALLVVAGRLLRWEHAGYRPTGLRPDRLLTPPSVVRTLRAGYRPMLHPSASSRAARSA